MNWFTRLSLRAQIMAGFCGMALLMIGLQLFNARSGMDYLWLVIQVAAGTGLGLFASEVISARWRKIRYNASEIAKGNLQIEPLTQVNRATDQLDESMNQVQFTISEMASEIERLVEHVRAGQGRTQADTSKYQGIYREILIRINEIVDMAGEKNTWYESIIDAVPFPYCPARAASTAAFNAKMLV